MLYSQDSILQNMNSMDFFDEVVPKPALYVHGTHKRTKWK